MITNFEKFNESIKLSQAKKYTQIWRDANMESYMAKEFDNKYRIYLPIDVSSISIEPDENIKDKVAEFLDGIGYEFENYNANLCKKVGTYKNFTKITKILQKYEETELLIAFNKDHEQLTKISDGYFVVISRHPVDIAGMTTGRRWKSCMDVDSGVNKQYVEADVKEGSIVAYLIKNDDKNIENPLSRILMKPYIYQKTGKVYLMPGSTYGTISEKFEETINNWLISVQGALPTGKFDINKNLYADRQATKWNYTTEVDNFLKKCCVDVTNVKYNKKMKTLEVECLKFELKSKIEGFTLSSMVTSVAIIDCNFLQDTDFATTKIVFDMIDFKNFDSDVDNKKLVNLFSSINTEITYINIYSDKQITSLEFLRGLYIDTLRIYANVKNIENDLNTIIIKLLKINTPPASIQSDSSLINFSPKSNKTQLYAEYIPNIYIDLGRFKNYISISNCKNLQIVNPEFGQSREYNHISNSNITTNVEDFNTQFVEDNIGYNSLRLRFKDCTFHGKPYNFDEVFN